MDVFVVIISVFAQPRQPCALLLASHAVGYFASVPNAASENDNDPAEGRVCLAQWWLLQLPLKLVCLVSSQGVD